MGFLDNLLRREVRKVISNAVDTVVDDTLKNAFGKDGGNSGTGNGAASVGNSAAHYDTANVRKENRKATGSDGNSGESLLGKRIEEIAAREWPEYELRKQIPSSQVEAPEGAEPFFEYGFYRDGKLVAVIKFLGDNNAYCRKSVRLARQACKEHQVAYLHFMSYMMNRPDYIAERLRKEIR